MLRDADGLTPRQAEFVRLYLGECHQNGTEAAKRAGYSERTAKQQAQRLAQRFRRA